LSPAQHVWQHSQQKVFPVTTGLPFSEARRMKFTLVAELACMLTLIAGNNVSGGERKIVNTFALPRPRWLDPSLAADGYISGVI
jgi:hypothetical protein